MPDSTAEEVPILIEEARSLIAAYTAGSLSLDRLAWRLESAVNALGDAGWPRYYDLWEIWPEIEAENAVCLDRNTNPNQALLGSLFADSRRCSMILVCNDLYRPDALSGTAGFALTEGCPHTCVAHAVADESSRFLTVDDHGVTGLIYGRYFNTIEVVRPHRWRGA